MNTLTKSSSMTPEAWRIERPAREAIVLVAASAVTAALLVLLGTVGLLAVPAAIILAGVFIRPEFGLYVLLASLMLPVPFTIERVVVYPHDAAAVAFMASAGLTALAGHKFVLPSASYLLPAGAMLAAAMLSLINAGHSSGATLGAVQLFYLLICAPIAYFVVLRDSSACRRVMRVFMALIAIQALLISAQFILARLGNYTLIDIFAFDRAMFRSTSRVFGTIGPTVGLLLVAASYLWMQSCCSWGLKSSMLMLHIFAIFATGTRSAMLAYVAAMIFYLLFTRKAATGLKLLIPAVAALLAFAALMGYSQFANSLIHPSDHLYRVPIDSKALSLFHNHPLIGHGTKAASQLVVSIGGRKKIGVENEYVARLYENGLLGLGALLLLGSVPVLATVVKAAKYSSSGAATRRGLQSAALSTTLAAVLVGFYAAAPAGCMFEGSLGHWVVFFYAAMLAGVASLPSESAAGGS